MKQKRNEKSSLTAKVNKKPDIILVSLTKTPVVCFKKSH